MPVDSSIYANVGKGPTTGIGAMSLTDLLNVARQSQTLMGEQKAGELLRQNIDEQGNLNGPGYMSDIRNNPRLNLVAPKVTSDAMVLQQQQLMRKTQEQNFLQNQLGSLGDNPTHQALTQAIISSSFVLNRKPSELIAQLGLIPNDPEQRKAWVNNLSNMALGSAGVTAERTGTPTATGQETTIPAGQAIAIQRGVAPAAGAGGTRSQRSGQVAAPGGGQVTGLAPGFEETAKGAAGAVLSLHAAADAVPQNRALLDNLGALSEEAVSGPTADTEKKINALWQRFFPGSGLTLTANQLRNSEEYSKVIHQIAGAQAGTVHADDAFLRNAYGSNPGLDFSKLGRSGVIAMLQGNNDVPEIIRGSWLDYKNGQVDGRPHEENEYRDWLHKFYKGVDMKSGKPNSDARFDPRVFQFARMSSSEKKDFLEMIKAKPGGDFERRVGYALKQGWIMP